MTEQISDEVIEQCERTFEDPPDQYSRAIVRGVLDAFTSSEWFAQHFQEREIDES